jgi:hypothetical protein
MVCLFCSTTPTYSSLAPSVTLDTCLVPDYVLPSRLPVILL